jgi:hypothetical protein
VRTAVETRSPPHGRFWARPSQFHPTPAIGFKGSRKAGAVFTEALGAKRRWSRRSAATTAPGVVLRVAGGIVRIIVHVVAGEDLGGRLRRGIDRLIGVAAGERERHKSQNDRDPHSRPPVQWRRGRRTREFGAVGDRVQ